jgi:undecaprenyl-diphosphatase
MPGWLENLLALDAQLSARLRVAEKPGPLRTLAAVLAHSGDSWFWAVALCLVIWLGDPVWRWRAVISLLSILVTALLVMALKFSIRRRRPEGEWGAIYRSTDPHSFPSGHASRALMLGVLLVFLGPGWLAAILLVWAPLVALARVAMGVHFLSDVVAGGALGVVLGLVIGLRIV